jgi:hypothetical protein
VVSQLVWVEKNTLLKCSLTLGKWYQKNSQ